MIELALAPVLPTLGGALLAGLVGSPHCVGMCGGFAVAASARGKAGALAWSLGRLTTYATLGALAGAAGQALPGPTWVGTAVAAAFLVWFAAKLAGVGADVSLPIPGLAKAGRALAGRADLPGRFAFGAVNGLLPCGLVYAALAFPVASGSALYGALAMVAFGLGTTPALAFAATGLRRLTAHSLGARRALAAGVLVLGLGSLFLRVPAPAAPEPPPMHTQP
jgi:sulfite exporter TauE/SafE